MPVTYKNEIKIVPEGFKETIDSLGKLTPDLKEAIRETVRKAIPFAQDEAVAQILNRYEISRANLMSNSRNGRWRFRPKYPTETQLSGGILVTGTRMPVMRFSVIPSTVPNQKGIPVDSRTPIEIRIVKKGRAQIGKPNRFLAKMRSGHIGVYKRKIPNPGGPRRKRSDGQMTQLPISEEYMLSVPEMLSGKRIQKRFQENLDRFVVKTLMAELRQVSFKAWARAKVSRVLGFFGF